MSFRSASYWDIVGTFARPGDATSFEATLVAVDGTRVATGRDFDSSGQVAQAVVGLDADTAAALASALARSDSAVRSVDPKPYTRTPYAPFRTATSQMGAGRK